MKKKYNKKVAERILAMIRADTYTITEVCNNVGISRQTFYNWLNDNPEFAQAVEDANNELLDKMNIEAKKSLMKKIKGYDVIETHVTTVPGKDGNPVIKEQKNVKKHIAADTAAIIFTLTNRDPERWKNRHSTEVTGKDGKDLMENKSLDELNQELNHLLNIIYAGKTDEELNKDIEEMQRKLDIENGFGSH